MPSKKSIFTPLSILFRPHQKPVFCGRFLVEAPGTAPGSNGFISPLIYRHIRQAGIPYIEWRAGFEKETLILYLNACGANAHFGDLERTGLGKRN